MIIHSKKLLLQPTTKYFEGSAKILAVLTYKTTGSSTSKYMVAGSGDAVTWYPIKALEKITTSIDIKTVVNANVFIYKNNTLKEFKYSSDGVNWSDITMPSDLDSSTFYSAGYSVYYMNGYYYLLMIGSAVVYKSKDFKNWTSVTYVFSDGRPVTKTAGSITPIYGGGYFYCCFYGIKEMSWATSALYRSTDGENWTYIQGNARYIHAGVACDNAGFVIAYGYTGSKGFSSIYFKNYSTSYSSLMGDTQKVLVSKKTGLVYARYNSADQMSSVDTFPTFTDASLYPSYYSEYFDFFYSGSSSTSAWYSKDLLTSTNFDFSSALKSNMTLSWIKVTAL